MLTLELTKPGDKPKPRLSLSLKKGDTFVVELFWDSEQDLDAHALLCVNAGDGAKVQGYEDVLSTHNTKKMNVHGVLVNNPNGSFSTPDGSLTHSGDSRTGVDSDVDESITFDGAKVRPGINEIPIFVTIYKGPETHTTFANVSHAGIRIKDGDGAVKAEYALSGEFGSFNAVQMGSIMLGADGWEFSPVGTGFNGDFNLILGSFS